jgi:hypothetical protein
MPTDLSPIYRTDQPNERINISEREDVELIHNGTTHEGTAEVFSAM